MSFRLSHADTEANPRKLRLRNITTGSVEDTATKICKVSVGGGREKLRLSTDKLPYLRNGAT